MHICISCAPTLPAATPTLPSPCYRSILLRLLRRNSMAALELHQRMEAAEGDKQKGAERDVVAMRTGARICTRAHTHTRARALALACVTFSYCGHSSTSG